MRQRIFTLAGYLLYRLATTYTGPFFVALTVAFYLVAFYSRTPEADYFTLVIGSFGAFLTFLVTLSIANKAQEAQSYPFLMRLESRVEYLAAVLIASLSSAFVLELLVALAALIIKQPVISLTAGLDIPPIWIAVNVLACVLALHASDFVARGWSRVWIFTIFALALVLNDGGSRVLNWIADLLTRASVSAFQQGQQPNAERLQRLAEWLNSSGSAALDRFFGILFWPFEAIINAVLEGGFNRAQALAPAALLLYATFLFLLASDYFSNKDLFLSEE